VGGASTSRIADCVDTARARVAFGLSRSISLVERITAYAATLGQCKGDQAATGKLFA
jgi:hypothetical protein